jgi:transcription-repair coupling factor (superfamily II helicase)
LRANDFLSIYQADSVVQTLAEGIRVSGPHALHIKGLHGSLDAVVFASVFKSVRASHVIILHDKEEAAYFQNDLQNLLGEREILLFPMSYKRPYEYDETENANILMRAEVLNQFATRPDAQIVITYPEALSEKVITKKSLASNTYVINVGEKLDREFLEEFLHAYDFEKTDFVHEAGQFAMRGGILDIFSFANELP